MIILSIICLALAYICVLSCECGNPIKKFIPTDVLIWIGVGLLVLSVPIFFIGYSQLG